ncbi:MAG: LPS assembly lipoprotein LptE [Spirochaetia bacterium]|nr:LPS assembly lipoprotein LptE [Spirochaetia bacterium]
MLSIKRLTTIRYFFNLLFLLHVFNGISCKSQDLIEGNQKSPIDGDEPISRKYKSIYVHNFENTSYEGDLTGETKEILTQKMALQKRFKVEPDKANADVWLYGKIEYYKLIPRDIDQFGKPGRYNMTVVATIWVRPNPKVSDETIFDKKSIRYDTFYSPEQPPFETEFTAKQRVVEGLCDRIVNTVITGWYSNLKNNDELGYDPSKQKKLLGN